MERFYNSQRESVLLGLDNSISNSNNLQIRRTESTNLSTPRRNSDVDFNDVFGGPPRHSLSGLQESNGEEGERGWCAWPPEREKPVFGDDNNGNRRRYSSKSNNNFFDDIFGGEESGSVCSTPKKRDVDAFASVVLSPARALPEPVGSSSSLPASFSLPAKLTKGVDLPTFGSPTRRRNPLINDGIASSNGLGSSDSHLSRFSTQAVQSKELQNDLKPSYRQSLLSHEFSDLSTSDEADNGSNMKQDISISEVSPSNTNDQFHFSIYKWASKGVPLAMPHRTSRIKDKVILKRCSSAKDWMASEITTRNPIAYNDSSLTENRKLDVSTTSTTTQNEAGLHEIVEQIVSAKAQSATLSSPQIVSGDVPGNSISYDTRAESSTHSVGEIGSEKTEAASKTLKLESKPLHSLFKQSDATVNPKKGEANTGLFQDVEHSKATSQGSSSLDKNMGKGRVKGKVKEFVQIFNQEAITKPRVDSKSRLQGSTYSQRGALRAKNEVEVDPEQSKENSATDTTNIPATNFCRQDDISASAIPDMSFSVIGDTDGSFHGNFMIQVLDQDEGEVLHNQEIQVIDNKIRHWSKGKEGNIRSLLSTLQHVLWPECGWKPVPLVDIIEGNAVKRAYQKALLYLHPDKLQQKGAASHQKYIAEKVFDILQEAWTQFNMLGAL